MKFLIFLSSFLLFVYSFNLIRLGVWVTSSNLVIAAKIQSYVIQRCGNSDVRQ